MLMGKCGVVQFVQAPELRDAFEEVVSPYYRERVLPNHQLVIPSRVTVPLRSYLFDCV